MPVNEFCPIAKQPFGLYLYFVSSKQWSIPENSNSRNLMLIFRFLVPDK